MTNDRQLYLKKSISKEIFFYIFPKTFMSIYLNTFYLSQRGISGLTYCISWLSNRVTQRVREGVNITEQTELWRYVTTRCLAHDLQQHAVLHAAAAETPQPRPSYCSNSISRENKNADYFIIEIQK